MEKILNFKKEVLILDINTMIDYYPGKPYYIGKDKDDELKETIKKRTFEEHEDRLDKSDNEVLKELASTDEVYHCYVGYMSETTLNNIYVEAQFSIGSLSLDRLNYELQKFESYTYEKFFAELDLLSSRFTNQTTDRRDKLRFKAIFKKHFKYSTPIVGEITRLFVNSLRDELKMRVKYLELLKKDIREMIAIKMKGVVNNVELINNKTVDLDYKGILNNAKKLADDPAEIKAYFVREQIKAYKKSYYLKESFYKALLKVLDEEKILSKCGYNTSLYEQVGGYNNWYLYRDKYLLKGYSSEEIEMLENIIIELFKEAIAQESDQMDEKKTSTQPFTIRRFDLQSINDALSPKTEGSYLNNIIFKDKFSYNNEESNTQKDSQLLSANLKDAKEEDLNKFKIEKEKSHSHVLKATGFSVFQWATIFYYADNSNLVPKKEYKKETRKAFIKLHHLNTTPAYFDKCFDKVNKRLNTTKDYPIEMLQAIIPFMRKNYKKTASIIKENIEFLIEEKTDRGKSDY